MWNINSNRLRGMAVAAVAILLSACAATSSQRTAGQTIDDSVVLARVKAALVGNDTTKARQINVDVYRGVVQLNGFVDSAAEKSTATRVAKDVAGVREVRNNLEVGAGERTAGNVVDDSVITARVKSALVADDRTKAHQINVTTSNGEVQLGGFVDSPAAKAAAGEVARAVQGVKNVDNELDVRR